MIASGDAACNGSGEFLIQLVSRELAPGHTSPCRIAKQGFLEEY